MRDRPLCSLCLVLLALILIRVFAGGERWVKDLAPSELEVHVQDGDYLTVSGQVRKLEQRPDYCIVYLTGNSIISKSDSFLESEIIVYLDSKEELHIGNRIQVRGSVSFYQNARNPGNFDQKLYYQKQNIHGFVWAEHAEILDGTVWTVRDRLYRFRKTWNETLLLIMGEEEGAALSAMILGEKAGMDPDLKELYQVNGIGHVLAISGLHLSFIGLGMYRILRKITGSYGAGGAAGILFLLLYIVMIGMTVSAVRALIMFLFRVGADMTGRHYDLGTALAVSAAVVLLWRPLYLYDGGFWMSFGAVLAMVLILPLFEGFPLSGIWANVSINLMLLPILLYYFYECPTYSMLLNLFVIPLMSALLALGMLGSLLSVFCMPAASLCLGICRLILRLYEMGCEMTLRLPASRAVAGQPELWQMLLYYILLVLVLFWIRSGRSRKILVVMVLASGFMVLPIGKTGKLEVTILDVGQGDGIFLRGPTGKTYLMDGGSSDIKMAGRYRIEPFLKSQGVGRLDYVFVSHGDGDHISGIKEMIAREKTGIQIGILVFPVQEVWDDALDALAGAAQKAGIRIAVMEAGQTIQEGDLKITCIQPGSGSSMEAGNAASMVLAAEYGEFDMLVTGDVEEEGEKMLLERIKTYYEESSLEILKVAHHGSKNSSSAELLELLHPSCAVISAGQENRYGHPHPETIRRLEAIGAKIYQTQESGAVRIRVEEDTMKIATYLQ